MIGCPSSAGAPAGFAEQRPAHQKGRVNGPLNDEAFPWRPQDALGQAVCVTLSKGFTKHCNERSVPEWLNRRGCLSDPIQLALCRGKSHPRGRQSGLCVVLNHRRLSILT